jgi:hypothetical protein
MKNQLAQINLGPLRGKGPLGLENLQPGEAKPIFNQALSMVIGVMTVVAFIWFTFQFLLGAIGILASGGDKSKLETARNKLSTSIIGLIVVVSAIFLIQLLGSILGIDILDPTSILPAI